MNNPLLDWGVKLLLLTGIIILLVLQIDSKNDLVYVDAQKLMVGYNGMKAARKELEDKSTVWKSNLDTLRGEVEVKIKEYESKKMKLSLQEKKLFEEVITAKQEQFVNYQQVIQEKFQKEDQELSKKVLDRVNDYVKRFGKKKGYSVILAATQYGNIIYAEEGMDVTEEVLKGLNEEFGK